MNIELSSTHQANARYAAHLKMKDQGARLANQLYTMAPREQDRA